tara:strand:+ start:296 stop:742 length:447 start_codon:yes stop_codon:yes gene_type:complete
MVDREIRALLVFEILGRPPEHIKKSLISFVTKLDEEKGIRVENKKIYEPKLLEDKDGNKTDLFTSFAEVELVFDDLNLLFNLLLTKLPSSVEIIEPSELKLKNFDLSSLLSTLAVKLHKYDEVAKALILERNNLMKQLKESEEKIKKD